MKTNINELAREISTLNSIEINKLTDKLLEYNINATIYQFGIIMTDDGNYNPTETFSVHMADAGNSKLAVVKLIKEVYGLGLRDAKNVVDNTPCLLAENLTYQDAKRVKTAFEDIGATISIND